MSKESLSKPITSVPLEPVVTISAEAKPLKDILATPSKPTKPPPAPPAKPPRAEAADHSPKDEVTKKPTKQRTPRTKKGGDKKTIKRKVVFYYDKDRTYMSNFMTNVKLSPEMQRDLKQVLGDENLWVMKGEHLMSDLNGITGINGEKKEDLIRQQTPKDYYNTFLKEHDYRVETKKMTGFSMYPVVSGNWAKQDQQTPVLNQPVAPVTVPKDIAGGDSSGTKKPAPSGGSGPSTAQATPAPGPSTSTPPAAPPKKEKAEVKVKTKGKKDDEEEVEEVSHPKITAKQIMELIVTSYDLKNSLGEVEEKLSSMSETFMKLTDIQQSVMAKFDVSNKADSRFGVDVWKAVLGGFLRLEGEELDEPLGMVLKDPSRWTSRKFWADLADDIIGSEDD